MLRTADTLQKGQCLGEWARLMPASWRRTGKCEARDRGRCKQLHDSSKVAVCPRWLAGVCTAPDCTLQHGSRPDLMPLCTFHLKAVAHALFLGSFSCTTKVRCPHARG
jgi:hypothetical protein